MGYLIQYDRLVEKSKNGDMTTAELAYLIQNFNPAELYKYEQARDLSIQLLEEWLVKYKFKNWKKTEGRGKTVTPAMRRKRAKEVGRMLNDPTRWNSHGRPISMDTLRREVGLQIDDFGADEELSKKIRQYYRLLKDYMAKMSARSVLHWNGAFLPLQVS